MLKNVHLDLSELFPGPWVMNVAAPVQIGNDDNSLLVMVVIEKPPSTVSVAAGKGGSTYLGDSTMIKLPSPSKAPITHCIIRGTRHDMSLLMKPQK